MSFYCKADNNASFSCKTHFTKKHFNPFNYVKATEAETKIPIFKPLGNNVANKSCRK